MHTDRVHYYSPYDMSISMQYERMEEVVKGYEEGKQQENINDYLEMYHILKFVENLVCPSSWAVERLEGIRRYKESVAKYFSQLDSQILIEQFNDIDFDYIESIWQIVDSFKIKKLVNEELLRFIVDKEAYLLRDLLKCKWIVEHNNLLIAKFLKENPHTAEWLLDQNVAESFGTQEDLFFPKSLSTKDKDAIIHDYVNSSDANLNYVRLVLYAKRGGELSLLPQTIKDARNKEKILNQEVFEHGVVPHFGLGVGVVSDENAPVKEFKNDEDGTDLFVYNRHVIDKCPDAFIPYYCAKVFEMMAPDGFIRHISKFSEVSVFERFIGIRAKNTYFVSAAFKCADNLSILQMQALNSVLYDKDRSMEGIIKHFYENYLNEVYGYKGLTLTLPSDEKEMVVKIRSLIVEMDAVAHQYDCFVENGSVDNDLIELTPPKKLTETRSLIAHRYCLLDKENSDVKQLVHFFFCDQSLLTHVEPCKEMHLRNFYALLEKGIKVKYDSYANFQKRDIDVLIDKRYLSKDEEGVLVFERMSEIRILKHLYEYGACGYWGYSPQERAILDDMVKRGWISFDNHLFTPAESDYYSYYLNNERFTNGPSIRNNYAHGTTPSYSKAKHEVNYYRLQVLFIMLLLKIAEDLDMKRFLEKKGIK